MLGYVWPPGKVVFPDFFKNKTKEWWTSEIKNYYNGVLKFDGLVILSLIILFGYKLRKLSYV
jgi:hypothetical protein